MPSFVAAACASQAYNDNNTLTGILIGILFACAVSLMFKINPPKR